MESRSGYNIKFYPLFANTIIIVILHLLCTAITKYQENNIICHNYLLLIFC